MRLVTPGALNTDPLQSFVGQERLKQFLQQICERIIPRGEAFPHSLITGPSGYGKTLIAERIADIIGSEYVSFLASPDLCRNDLSHIFSSVKNGAVVHLDEAHAFQRCCFEFFYDLIDKKSIPSPGEKRPDVVRRVRMPSFTLIMSTNYPGRIPKPLRTRMMMFELDEYSSTEMEKLAARELHRDIEPGALSTLVESAQGNPRILKQMIAQLEMVTVGNGGYTCNDVDRLRQLKNIGPLGLSNLQQEYLSFLESQPEARALVTALSLHLGIDEVFLRKEVEPYLVRQGFISYVSPGRKLSKRGRYFVHSVLQSRIDDDQVAEDAVIETGSDIIKH